VFYIILLFYAGKDKKKRSNIYTSDTNMNYSDVQYDNMTTAAGGNGRRNDDNGIGGGVDVRVKLKSEKRGSPNTSMASGNDTSSASTTLWNQSSGGSSQGTTTRIVAEKEHHLALQYREQKEEKRGSESDDGSPVHCSSQVEEYQKQQLMAQQQQQQQNVMEDNRQQPRPHSAMTLHPTLGSNGSVSSFQQHHYAHSETFGDVPQMAGHRINRVNDANHHDNFGGNSGNVAVRNVASMSSANYLQKSVSCQRIDEMLKDSMDAFHRDGPLVSPLCTVKPGGSERHKNRHAFGGDTAFSGGSWMVDSPMRDRISGGSWMVDSPMRDRMSYVCESKGFDYGIFWKLDRQRTSLMPAESLISPRIAADTTRLKLFVNTSKTLFTRYVLGFGMPGRVCHSGNYEWHEDISLLPGWSFQRKVQAERAGLKTIICVPVENGVVEFGLTDEMDHSVNIVQYVQKMCKSLASSQ